MDSFFLEFAKYGLLGLVLGYLLWQQNTMIKKLFEDIEKNTEANTKLEKAVDALTGSLEGECGKPARIRL
jgi:hypothetical protein